MADNEKICFGISWDAHDATCTGCPVFAQCRTEKYKKFAASAAATQSVLRAPVIPPGNLVRTNAVTSAPAARPPQFYPTQQYAVPTHTRYTPQTAPPPQRPPEQQARYLPAQPQTPSPQAQYFPAIFHPVQHLMPNEQAPFLTVLEPITDDLPIWKRIMAESCRAALKGVLGHGTFLADHLTVFKPPK